MKPWAEKLEYWKVISKEMLPLKVNLHHLQLVRCLKNLVKTQVQITKNSFDKLTKLVICKKKWETLITYFKTKIMIWASNPYKRIVATLLMNGPLQKQLLCSAITQWLKTFLLLVKNKVVSSLTKDWRNSYSKVLWNLKNYRYVKRNL